MQGDPISNLQQSGRKPQKWTPKRIGANREIIRGLEAAH